jgi:hypothetical protein
MKIVHILKKTPTASIKRIIEVQAASHDVKIIELYKGDVSYDKLVADVFSSDKIFCW